MDVLRSVTSASDVALVAHEQQSAVPDALEALVALQADELPVDAILLTDPGGPGVGPMSRGSAPPLLSSAKSIEILRRQGSISQTLTPSSCTVPPAALGFTGQLHEDDPAEVIIVCEPDLNNNVMGSIHPHGALYERPVNVTDSRNQHQEFRRILRSHGVHCLTVHQILTHDVDRNLRARMELENFAASRLTYTLDADYDAESLSEEEVFYLGEKYKAQVLAAMSSEHLIDMIMTVPTVHLKPSMRDTGFTASYHFDPLTNLQYTRDQQITTAKGIVMGRLRSLQRQNEVEVMQFCFEKLGLNVVGLVEEPGFLEGGDFYVAGTELCMLGVGLRTNLEAAEQLMKKDLFGTTRVAVVHDHFEQDQARMHLDCVFNILGRDCVVLAEDCIGENSPVRRLVTEYVRCDDGDSDAHAATGCYRKASEGTEFCAYLKAKGFNVIPLSRREQLEYGCNSINLGNGRIVACNREASRNIIQSGLFSGSIEVVDFGSITAMYGGLHCSTQVVRRRPTSTDPAPPSPADKGVTVRRVPRSSMTAGSLLNDSTNSVPYARSPAR